MRLRQCEGAEPIAARHGLEETLFLLLASETEDRRTADGIGYTHHRGNRAVAGGNFLQRQNVAHMIAGGPVIGLRHQHTHEPERAHFADALAREIAAAVPFGRERRQLLGRKAPREIAHLLLFGCWYHLALPPVTQTASNRMTDLPAF